MIFFEHGDELTRRDGPAVRIVPAGQGFETGGPVGFYPANALIEDFDPAFLQSQVQILNDIAFSPVMLVRHLGIKLIDGIQVAADALESVFGMVDGVIALGILIKDADAGLDAGGVAVGFLPDFIIDGDQPLRQICFVNIGIQKYKMIIRTAGNQRIREVLLELARDEQDEFIPLSQTILVVVELHGNNV